MKGTERIVQFAQHAADLWQQSNFDQRIILSILATLSIAFVLLVAYISYWRFVNRHELRKFYHFIALRDVAFREPKS